MGMADNSMRKDYPIRSCDPATISRFFDGELDAEAAASVCAHLDTCSVCRQALEEHRIISENFQIAIAEGRSKIDFDLFEKNLLRRLRTRPIPWRSKLLEFVRFKLFYIPATVLTTVLILFFTFFYPAAPSPSPSAIISSFTGNISSVMIFETTKTHHTILWINEDLPANG